MISRILKLKRNKLLFTLAVICTFVVFFDIAMLAFNVIHFIVISGMAANFSGAFLPLNITAICLNAVCIVLIIAYLILKKMGKVS